MHLLHENYLTVREVAEIFKVTQHTVYSWIKSGDLAAVQVGGTWRIPQSQFERGAFGAPPRDAEEVKADE